MSLQDRCPTWAEMCYFKGLFWSGEETVLQFHVPAAEHVNYHEYCLHMWRPTVSVVPRPPAITVGRELS